MEFVVRDAVPDAILWCSGAQCYRAVVDRKLAPRFECVLVPSAHVAAAAYSAK